MIPWVHIDKAAIPGGGELRLKRRGAEFSISLGTNELMNSRLSGSEEALATLPCTRLSERERAAVLIGGLGMGFTLRAALGVLGPKARIVVAELVPQVVAWARGPMAEIFHGSLDDPRVAIHEGDVGALIGRAHEAYDAILLDVDNGPTSFVQSKNRRIYNRRGLGVIMKALKPGGRVAFWSAEPEPAFRETLTRAGFHAEEHPAKAHERAKRFAHMIYVGER